MICADNDNRVRRADSVGGVDEVESRRGGWTGQSGRSGKHTLSATSDVTSPNRSFLFSSFCLASSLISSVSLAAETPLAAEETTPNLNMMRIFYSMINTGVNELTT